MRQFLIPSGQINFSGSHDQLLEIVHRANGTLLNGRQFHLYFPQPSFRFFLFRRSATFSTWRFRCTYEPSELGFLISYQVRPGFSVILPILFLLVSSIANLFLHGSNPRGWFLVPICALITAVLGLLFYFERREYMRRFQNLFTSVNSS